MSAVTPETWAHWGFLLNCEGHLLPVVPASPDTRCVPGSALEKKLGKIPSAFTRDGLAHGLKDWNRRPILANETALWSQDSRYSICLRLGEISHHFAIDCDVTDATMAQEIERAITTTLGLQLPKRFRSNSPKFLLLLQLPGSLPKRIINTAHGRIEFLGSGQQCLLGGQHPSGVNYEWAGGLPQEIPTLTVEQFEAVWTALHRFSIEPVKPAKSTPAVTNTADGGVLTEIPASEWSDLLSALRSLYEAAVDQDLWSEVGYALLSLEKPHSGQQLFIDWSRKAKGWTDGAPERWLEDHRSQTPRSDYRHIFSLAREHGWSKVAPVEAFEPVVSSDVADVMPPAALALEPLPESFALNTDLCNAHRLHTRYHNELLVGGGQFYHFAATHWEKDETFASRAAAELPTMVKEEAQIPRTVFETLALTNPDAKKLEQSNRRDRSGLQDKVLATAPEIVHALDKAEMLDKWARQCESRNTQRNAIELLRSLCTFDVAKLDRDPHLLNCLNGTIDLRTGELRSHSPLDFITKVCPVKYEPTASAPRFERFLSEVMAGDQAKVDFLRRWFGYAATGETREQKVVFHVGPGGGGKGTLLRAVSDVLGNYTCTAARGLVTGRGGEERHPTEIIDLMGKRLVTAHESDQGADLREGFIKQLSGEDPLKGRAMRQDFVEFLPTHKLQMLTNYPPTVQGSDYGIWRRLVLVPYAVKFGSAEDVTAGKATQLIDPTLPEALRGEREGVFAWIVAGAVEWYRVGLQVPEVIRSATDVYQSEQDRAEQFVADRCVKDDKGWVSNTDLHMNYKAWCHDHGYMPLGWGKLVVELQRVLGSTFVQDKTGRKIGKAGAGRKTVRGCHGLSLIDGVLDKFISEPAPPLLRVVGGNSNNEDLVS